VTTAALEVEGAVVEVSVVVGLSRAVAVAPQEAVL
jgi:hypothetical protein